jgi:hypothetical protein
MRRVSIVANTKAIRAALRTYALLLSLEPFSHFASSAAADFASAAACFDAAASAFFALPAAFLVFSPFLITIAAKSCVMTAQTTAMVEHEDRSGWN